MSAAAVSKSGVNPVTYPAHEVPREPQAFFTKVYTHITNDKDLPKALALIKMGDTTIHKGLTDNNKTMIMEWVEKGSNAHKQATRFINILKGHQKIFPEVDPDKFSQSSGEGSAPAAAPSSDTSVKSKKEMKGEASSTKAKNVEQQETLGSSRSLPSSSSSSPWMIFNAFSSEDELMAALSSRMNPATVKAEGNKEKAPIPQKILEIAKTAGLSEVELRKNLTIFNFNGRLMCAFADKHSSDRTFLDRLKQAARKEEIALFVEQEFFIQKANGQYAAQSGQLYGIEDEPLYLFVFPLRCCMDILMKNEQGIAASKQDFVRKSIQCPLLVNLVGDVLKESTDASEDFRSKLKSAKSLLDKQAKNSERSKEVQQASLKFVQLFENPKDWQELCMRLLKTFSERMKDRFSSEVQKELRHLCEGRLNLQSFSFLRDKLAGEMRDDITVGVASSILPHIPQNLSTLFFFGGAHVKRFLDKLSQKGKVEIIGGLNTPPGFMMGLPMMGSSNSMVVEIPLNSGNESQQSGDSKADSKAGTPTT